MYIIVSVGSEIIYFTLARRSFKHAVIQSNMVCYARSEKKLWGSSCISYVMHYIIHTINEHKNMDIKMKLEPKALNNQVNFEYNLYSRP